MIRGREEERERESRLGCLKREVGKRGGALERRRGGCEADWRGEAGDEEAREKCRSTNNEV